MGRRTAGFTVVELLVAAVIMAIILGAVALYFAQQSRATSDGQAHNDVELSARTVAEGVAQDLQLAGSRAAIVGGAVDYVTISDGCKETSRSACVVAHEYASDGGIGDAPDEESINGYAIYYRTSLVPAEPCRRVDFAYIGTTLYRSDVECSAGIGAIDLDASAFAENVTSFGLTFACTDGSAYRDPADCYATPDQYVTGATVSVTVASTGRSGATSDMALSTLTPNMRPSVDYLRDIDADDGGGAG